MWSRHTPTHLGFGRLLCQLQHTQLSRLKLLFGGEMFKFPRFQSPAFARKPPEVNGFSLSLTHPLEPENQLGSGPRSVTVVGESACQPGSHSVSLPVLTSLSFQCRSANQSASQRVSQYSQAAGLKMWSKMDHTDSHSAVWLDNGH